MTTKYLNPYTDFGFKKLFAEEGSKDLLMDFLNQLLPSYHQVVDLNFKNPEKIPSTPKERKAICNFSALRACFKSHKCLAICSN